MRSISARVRLVQEWLSLCARLMLTGYRCSQQSRELVRSPASGGAIYSDETWNPIRVYNTFSIVDSDR